jgi:2-dehydro-3-deoxyglucarate aldolase
MTTDNPLVGLGETNDVLLGAGVETGNETLVEILGRLGLDWVWIDLEHKNPSPYDSHYLERLRRAADCGETELVVRVPNGEPSLVRKISDAGIRNICVPRVQTAEEVQEAVRAGKYEYDGGPGRRGLSQGRASGYGDAFTKSEDSSFHHDADEEMLVGILIEDIVAVENLDDILDTPELGFVFPGPGDLGVSLRKTLQYDDEEVQVALDKVVKGCVEREIPLLGLHGSNFSGPEGTREAIKKGYQILGLGNDFKAVRQVLDERMDWIEKG